MQMNRSIILILTGIVLIGFSFSSLSIGAERDATISLVLDKWWVPPGTTVTGTGLLLDRLNGNPIPSAPVLIEHPLGTGWLPDKTVTTDENGQFQVSWTLTDQGNHTYRASYAGTTIYVPCSILVWFMVSSDPKPTKPLHTVTILAGDGGSVTPSGKIVLEETTKITVAAVPSAGYKFDHWTQNGNYLDTDNPLTYTVTGDYTITAVFILPAQPSTPPNKTNPTPPTPPTPIHLLTPEVKAAMQWGGFGLVVIGLVTWRRKH